MGLFLKIFVSGGILIFIYGSAEMAFSNKCYRYLFLAIWLIVGMTGVLYAVWNFDL